MPASRDSGAEQIEILPLVIVTQAFPTRPSSLPDIRDFVRRRLAPTTLSEDDVRTLCDRVAEVLLDAAGGNGTIQVSLRIFPTYAEVDVLFLQPGEDADRAQASGTTTANGSRAAERSLNLAARATTNGAGPAAPAEDELTDDERPVFQPSAISFADWLSSALRREGMTLEAAARKLKVSAKTVSRWVGGTTEPRLRDLARIREVFGELPFP